MGPIQVLLIEGLWLVFSFRIALEHQVDTNMKCSKHEKQSSNWLYSSVFNSMTVKLHDHVIPTYNEICSSWQGGITLSKLVLDENFFMSWNVINALKNFLMVIGNKGFTCIKGKNVSLFTKKLFADVVSLHEVGSFPDETYGNILCGFTMCSD